MTENDRTLDLDAVRTFTLVAALASFTRAAEATGATQSAVSLKIKRLERSLGRRLVARTPRSVRLTADGETFLPHAQDLLDANRRAVSFAAVPAFQLRLGISDHVAGHELPALLARLGAADPAMVLEVGIGFSQHLLDAFDRGALDAVVVRREPGRRGGEMLGEDEYAWFGAPGFEHRAGEPLWLANLAAPCGVRTLAVQALDRARIPWREVFVGGGVAAVGAAAGMGLAVAALARRLAPAGCVDLGPSLGLPRLPRCKTVLHARAADPRAAAAFRIMAAVFRRGAA